MSKRGEAIYKRKDGRWEARVLLYRENGKSKYKSLYAKTYSEAKHKKIEYCTKMFSGNTTKLRTNSTKFYTIANIWLDEIKHKVKESTYTRYHRIAEKCLIPRIGNIRLTDMDIPMLNRFTYDISKNGSTRGSALSPKTVSDILSVLKQIINRGNACGYSNINTALINCPKFTLKKAEIINCGELCRLEKLLWNLGDTLALGILFSLFTGVRIGELCGLRWGDIDFVYGTVKICRTVERIADISTESERKTKVILSEPKTDNSKRIIPLPNRFIEYLSTFRRDDACYLLTGTKNYCEPHNMYVRYTRLLKRNGFEKHTFHALRHTFATQCVEVGFDVKSLSEILGHADVSTTMRCYVHPSMNQKRKQMELLCNQKMSGTNNCQFV